MTYRGLSLMARMLLPFILHFSYGGSVPDGLITTSLKLTVMSLEEDIAEEELK